MALVNLTIYKIKLSTAMITQYEVPAFLQTQLPQLNTKIYISKKSLAIYIAISNFTDCTKHAVEEHNFNLAKKCFALAETLYRQGDNLVRLLIENSFVYSFSSFMPQNQPERLIIRSIIPARLYDVYMKQVMQSGC
jgi:hypothetical protein